MPLTITLSDEEIAEIIESLECHNSDSTLKPEFRAKVDSLIARLSRGDVQPNIRSLELAMAAAEARAAIAKAGG